MAHYPLVRGAKPAVIWVLPYIALLLAVAFDLPVLVIPIVFFSPVYLSLCGAKGGILPLLLCVCGALLAVWFFFHSWFFVLLCGLYLIPFGAVNALCFIRKIPFWKAVALHISVLVVSQTLILAIIRTALGGDLFWGGAEFLVNQLSKSPFCDQVLLWFYQLGLLSVPEEMVSGTRAVVESLFTTLLTQNILTATVRTELLNGLRTLLESFLYSYLPNTAISNSIMAGVFSVALPVASGRKDGFPTLDMPPFSAWHLSRRTGIRVLLLALGGALPYLIPNVGILLAGRMMSAAFSTVFILQGAALFTFIQAKQGTRVFYRRLFPCLMYLFIPQLLMILGLADQFFNIRGLRKPNTREES